MPGYRIALLLTISSLLTVVGCSGGSKEQLGILTGVVTVDSVPLEQGTVSVFSESLGAGQTIEVDAKGNYKSGSLPVGDYQVAIEPLRPKPGTAMPAPSGPTIPKKYHYKGTSNLSTSVKVGQNKFDISLTK